MGLGDFGTPPKSSFIISEFRPNFGWRGTNVAGNAANLERDRPYPAEVRVTGQRVTLTVDGIKVLDHILDAPLAGEQVGLFAWGTDRVDFTDVVVEPEAPLAFVAMPFSEPFTHLYEDVIRPIAAEMGIQADAVSEVYRPGIILEDIRQGIAEAKVVIVEITSDNPNVYYELGYAHGLNKPTILLAEREKTPAFDISSYRVIFYDNSIHGKQDVEDNLRRHLTAILRD